MYSVIGLVQEHIILWKPNCLAAVEVEVHKNLHTKLKREFGFEIRFDKELKLFKLILKYTQYNCSNG